MAAETAVEGLVRSSEKNWARLFRFFNIMVEIAGSISVRVRSISGRVVAVYAAMNPP